MIKKDYSIALDIGTNSVGYAVINDDYKVPVKKMKVLGNTSKKTIKKNMLGVLLFNEGQTAADTRLKRGARRRYTRRKNRLRYLQEIFAPELVKVDPNFFHRLEESSLVAEDKKYENYPLFGNREEELAYHATYKTIYHLRSALANTDEQVDLRLVYAALAHIIKYRGNFLIEGKIDLGTTDINKVFAEFSARLSEESAEELGELDVADIFKDDTLSKTKKVTELLQISGAKRNQLAHQLFKLMVGNIGSFKKVFGTEEEYKLSFGKDTYEEDLDELLAEVGDQYRPVFVAAKKVYDAAILASILDVKDTQTKTIFSQAMIERYAEHQKELKELKRIFKKYLPEKCHDFFSDPKFNGYAGYIEGKTREEDFYKYTKKTLKGIPETDEILKKIDANNYLRKQRVFDNGSIPHQVQLKELIAIIENQGRYYPFLLENKDKLEKILKFKIPYYVGPLARRNSRFAWLKRKCEGKITPYNFEEMVDKEISATRFIERMTINDLYFPAEPVLPKHSLLYEKYNIFNELASVKYVMENGEGKYFDAKTRRAIFEIFKEEKKVTEEMVIKHLRTIMPEIRIQALTGLHGGKFNASYGTYHDLIRMGIASELLNDENNSEKWEDIIKTLTIFEGRDLIKRRLSEYRDFLGEDMIRKLSRKKYTGWGRRSAKLIDGIYDKKTNKTILDCLMTEDYSQNFNKLIKDSTYSFKKMIQDAQVIDEEGGLTETVQELPGSPAIKKGILQSIEIVDELVKVMGYRPKSIVIEMARETQKTHGTHRRKERIQHVFEKLKDTSGLPEELPSNAELSNEREYLYWLQGGKDLYTGKWLDHNSLPVYDVDHVIPRSFVKDDSIENKVLTAKTENDRKTNGLPSEAIIKKRGILWKELLDAKAMTRKKYDNLRRNLYGGLTEEMKANFTERQLVETRQITKYVAQLLDKRFNQNKDDEKVKIITLKAQLVSHFREILKLHKVRAVNNLHHAHDAYLNAVVANLIMASRPDLEDEFVYGKYRKAKFKGFGKATAKHKLYSNVLYFIEEREVHSFWDETRDLPTIKRYLYRAQVNKVRKAERQTGGFSDEMLVPKNDSGKLLPRKEGLDPAKYGGYAKAAESYAVLITADEIKKGKTKKVKTLVNIPIIDSNKYEADPTAYLADRGYTNVTNSFIFPKYSLLEDPEGRRRYLASFKEFQKANELILPQHLVELLYWVNAKDGEQKLEDHKAEFKELFDKIMEFADKYVVAPKNSEKVRRLYEENQDATPVELGKNFIELLKYTADGAACDFKFFGENIPRKRYSSVGDLLKGTLIYQSKTGLYETRIDLDKM
jgi:CRISPR-associated endonuclease Csn1